MQKNVWEKGLDIEMWTGYEDWCSPINPCDIVNDHKDWDEPMREKITMKAYDLQYYLQRGYNFIMEFQFETNTKGYGYLYALEYRR